MTNPLPDEAQSILEFWFNGKMKENYKYKWFPTGSLGLQKQADDEIQKHFLSIFIKAINGQLSLWLYSRRATVALIVALDQFSRHIYRSLPADASERVLADQLALQLAERFTENEEWDSGLTVAEFVFSLMPLRHTATVSRLERVMSEIERRRTNVVEEQELLTKFMKQTLRRLQHLQDRSKVQETEGILERQSFVTDESDILAHPLTRATAAFLDRMGVSPTQTLV
eukprot:gene44704-59668_t